MDKLLIVDGNSMLNRGFYGLSGNNLLRTKEGIYTNAIYGFLGIMQKVLKEEKPEYICVTFDVQVPTFRHEMYSEYKANRKGMPDELGMQLPYMKEILAAMNIHVIDKEGYEADDIIGTMAKQMKNDMKVLILTGDRDSFQLVEDNINVLLPHTVKGQTTMEHITKETIKEKYGLEPEQMIEVKALMGDNSDNIPGVPGIGEKTALTLIKKYKTIEGIYEYIENNPDQIDIRGKQLENIVNNKDLAILSKQLGTIMLNVPIEYTKEDIKTEEYKYNELYEILKRLELKSYIEKFDLLNHISINIDNEIQKDIIKNDSKLVVVNSESQIEELINEIRKNKLFIYYFSKKDRYTFEEINKFLFHVGNTTYSITNMYMSKEIFNKYFKQIFESADIQKIGYDLKRDYIMLNKMGIEYNNLYFDILIAAFLIEPNNSKCSLEDLIHEYTGLKVENNSVENEQITFDLGFGSAEEEKQDKNEYDSQLMFGLKILQRVLADKLEQLNEYALFLNIEMPLVRVLGDMEIEGVYVDTDVLDILNEELKVKIAELEKEICDLAGEEFNISSPKQLGEVLFEKMKLPVIKKNKTGYSTDGEVLEQLIEEHEIIGKILEYRQYVKLKTTYIDGLKEYIKENRIHTKLVQTTTATGRLSSIEPNLQNIPVRDEYGKNFRKVFVAKEGCVLLDADYSQIELRVLAHLANDTVMIDGFKNDIDVHTLTAMKVFGLKENQVTSEFRTAAKAVNFGIVYGISDYGLAKSINKGVRESREYIERYFRKYRDIKAYLTDVVRFAKEHGYVETMFHRRRYIQEIYSSNFNVKKFGQRVAMNTCVQGTAAEIIKIAMINIHEELKKNNLKSRLVLQIHDELIIETNNEEIEKVKEILVNGMQNAVQLNVPLKVDVKVGKSWYDTK